MDWHERYRQQARWTAATRAYLFERAGLNLARRILEVGCGTAAIWESLPISPDAQSHGLDLAWPALCEARLHYPELRAVQGAGDALPYPADWFDLTFCHFLLLWTANPALVLREMARVTRRGGAVLALAEPDYAARVDEPVELGILGRWQAESLRRQGANPQMGRLLAGAFADAGIQLIENGVIGGGWGAWSPADVDLEWEVLESDLAGQILGLDIEKFQQIDRLARLERRRVLFVPTFYAWGIAGAV